MLKDIKYTGLNTASSGYDATAGQLAVAHNVVNEHGYIEPLAPGKEIIQYTARVEEHGHGLMGYTCVFKHEMLSGITNYIFYKEGSPNGSLKFLSSAAGDDDEATEVYWQENSIIKPTIGSNSGFYGVVAINNTLCVLTMNGMDYFVWTTRNISGTDITNYFELGTDIPNIELQFALAHHTYNGSFSLPEPAKVSNRGGGYGHVTFYSGTSTPEIYGEINELTDRAQRDGYIVYPFLVRYAIQLYDGTLIKHSSPVYMRVCDSGLSEPYTTLRATSQDNDFFYFGYGEVNVVADELQCKYLGGYSSDWDDIINGVEIYISKPYPTLDQSKNISTFRPGSTTESHSHKYATKINDTYGISDLADIFSSIYTHPVVLPLRSVDDQLKEESIFYRVKALKSSEVTSYSDFTKIELKDILPALEAQPILVDEYHSHDMIIPKGAYLYNQRINQYDIKRRVRFDQNPASLMQYFDSETSANYYMYVRIEKDGVSKWIVSRAATLNDDMVANFRYFYFPDTHAKELLLYLSSVESYSIQLEEHNSLNGAAWFDNDGPGTLEEYGTPTTSPVEFEEPNKIYTSEVGNPFYFPLDGINTVGVGKILALASSVKAISQGQFGQFPLYVFTDSGIWMLETDDKGLYKAKQPMSLDCILDKSRVTPMDDAVAYVIERGLMIVSGADTMCISEPMDGKLESVPTLFGGTVPGLSWENYKNYKDTTLNTGGIVCAYDEINRRLHVYNYAYGSGTGETPYHYVYSTRTKLWSTMSDSYIMKSTLNGKYINTTHGLLDITQTNTQASMPIQTILTRPINFDTDAYKRMRDNIQRGDIDALRAANTGRKISVLLQGSNDLQSWHDIAAVTMHYRIVRKSGTPYKWFRWKVVIESEAGKYQLRGLTADVDVTGNNKLR